MAKITKETESTINNNLEYIGLNLDKIPNFITPALFNIFQGNTAFSKIRLPALIMKNSLIC